MGLGDVFFRVLGQAGALLSTGYLCCVSFQTAAVKVTFTLNPEKVNC